MLSAALSAPLSIIFAMSLLKHPGRSLLLCLMLSVLTAAIPILNIADVSMTLPGLESTFNEPAESIEPTLQPSIETEPEGIVVKLSRKYIPVFQFDKDAGSYCFPDDKRQHTLLSGTCKPFSKTAYVFVNARSCEEYDVYQYNLWFGLQKPCGFMLPAKWNGSTYVQVWTNSTDGKVEKVRYGQHEGYYFRRVGSGVELLGNRTIVYIGQYSHGAFHQSCSPEVLKTGTKRCSGGCGIWEDFRRPGDNFRLDRGTLVQKGLEADVDCNPAECRPGNAYQRSTTNSSCYGIHN